MNKIAFDLGDQYIGSDHFLTETTGVGKLIEILYNNAIIIAGVILIFLLIYAGQKMQSNWENPDAIKEGQKILTYAILGFTFIVAAWFIVRILEASLGIDILGGTASPGGNPPQFDPI